MHVIRSACPKIRLFLGDPHRLHYTESLPASHVLEELKHCLTLVGEGHKTLLGVVKTSVHDVASKGRLGLRQPIQHSAEWALASQFCDITSI